MYHVCTERVLGVYRSEMTPQVAATPKIAATPANNNHSQSIPHDHLAIIPIPIGPNQTKKTNTQQDTQKIPPGKQGLTAGRPQRGFRNLDGLGPLPRPRRRLTGPFCDVPQGFTPCPSMLKRGVASTSCR